MPVKNILDDWDFPKPTVTKRQPSGGREWGIGGNMFFKKLFKKYKKITEKSKYALGFDYSGKYFVSMEKSTGQYHLHRLTKAWDLSTMYYCGVVEKPKVLKEGKGGWITMQPKTIILSDGSKYTFSDEWESKNKEGI